MLSDTLRDTIVSCFVASARHGAAYSLLGRRADAAPPTPHEEVKLIEAIVAAHSSGIGIADIEAEFERLQDDKLKVPDVVQSSMGHASPVTLSRYTRSSVKRQFSEVAKVFGE